MKPDELRLLAVLLAADDSAGYLNVYASGRAIGMHERRLLWLVEKWQRKGYWAPLLRLTGHFTPDGRRWAQDAVNADV